VHAKEERYDQRLAPGPGDHDSRAGRISKEGRHAAAHNSSEHPKQQHSESEPRFSTRYVETTLQTIANEHHEEVAEALKQLTEGIADSTALTDPVKTEALEAVSVLAKQAGANPEERSSVTVKAVLNWIPSLIGMAADLTTLWDKVGPTIRAHLGI
jgi:hypothetical protein